MKTLIWKDKCGGLGKLRAWSDDIDLQIGNLESGAFVAHEIDFDTARKIRDWLTQAIEERAARIAGQPIEHDIPDADYWKTTDWTQRPVIPAKVDK